MSAVHKLITDHLEIWTAADTEKKSGRGRASGNANSVYGIKKLRELILELAVRGKLVPQDPNDEPASELLKQIQVEKAGLVAEGKTKKETQFEKIDDKDKPFRLPVGWSYSYLGEAVEIIRGITFPGSEKIRIPEIGRVACLRTSNVQDQIEWEDILYIREEFVSRPDQILKPNDIVMSMANSRELVGKVALVGKEIHQRTSFGGFLGVLRPYLIEPRFVMALLRTPHTRETLIDSASQTTNIANISLAKLRPLIFAIPPLAEQHRIVAKVDELMALCDQLEAQHNNAADAHEQLVSHLLSTLTQSQDAEDFNANWQRIATHFDTLFTTESSIDALKQALLQLAVMGKLVPQDPNDEPASELLQRIQVEKAKLIAEGKIKKDKPLASISEHEKPFNLPSNWAWTRLQNAIDVRDGTHDSPKEAQGSDTFPLVTSKDFNQGEINFESARRISAEDHFEISKRSLVEKHDILFSMIGGNIGNQAMVLDDRPFSIKNVALFKYYDPNLTDPYFVKKYLENLAQTLQATAVGGAQPFVALGALRNLIFPMPPIEEQHRIVTKVDKLMILCEQLKSRITDSKQCQQKLADVLLVGAID